VGLVADPQAALAAVPTIPAVDSAADPQVAPALVELPTTAAIHQVAVHMVVSAELHLEALQHPVTPVAVITAAAIVACIDARDGTQEI
jgi:hypothetical protein